jgi:voltage-gated potassium channel
MDDLVDSALAVPGSGRARRWRGFDSAALSIFTAAAGAFLLGAGVASSYLAPPDLYPGILVNYDPPFDAVGGVLLLALSIGIRQESRVAWLFSTVAPAITIAIAVLSPNIFSLACAGLAVLLLAVLYPSRALFRRGPLLGTETAQYAVLVVALASVLLGMVGGRFLGSQFSPRVDTWSQALYFTITTISTNGSTTIPLTDDARLFVVALIIFGVSAFLSAIVVFFVPFLERRIAGVASRLERTQMEQLSQHVIVCGTSPEVRAVAEAFRHRDVPVVVLSPDANEIQLLQSEGHYAHLGESSSEDALRDVGVDRARALVAADSSDAENLLTVMTVRSMVPSLPVVAVASSDASIPKLRRAGASEAISLINVAAQLVLTAALRDRNVPPPNSTAGASAR